MIHYTCDLCHRQLDGEDEVRYVVKIEVYPAADRPEAADPDDDRDHLLELHDALESLADDGDDDAVDPTYQTMQFDLCAECRRKFAHQPLGRDLTKLLDISTN
jgi:hypothetical protein